MVFHFELVIPKFEEVEGYVLHALQQWNNQYALYYNGECITEFIQSYGDAATRKENHFFLHKVIFDKHSKFYSNLDKNLSLKKGVFALRIRESFYWNLCISYFKIDSTPMKYGPKLFKMVSVIELTDLCNTY